MATNLATVQYHVQAANSFIGQFANTLQNAAYFFVADCLTHSSNIIQPANTDVFDVYNKTYSGIVFGKKLTPNNFILAITNYPYTPNTVYAMYDDKDPLLLTEQHYTIVNAGSFSHVFRVLDNNNGSPSTIQPDFTQITGANTIIYQTSDGYRWKYLYSVDATTIFNVGTPQYFPFVPNTQVSSAAVAGTIDICKIIQPGVLYNNWTKGILRTSDIAVGGNPTIFNLSNNQVSTVNGFYNQCIMYLTSGGGIGQFAVVNSSFSNTTGNFLQIANGFPIVPTNGSTFEVYPQLQVVGPGTETQEVIARALVNSISSNSIYRVEVLQRGIGFANVVSANVLANSVVGVGTPAQIRPILSPPGGHGFNMYAELNATNLIIWQQFSGSESNTIPITNQYQQIGILFNPTFSNVHLTLINTTFPFQAGETASLINPVQAQPLCNVQISNNYVQSNTGSFLTQFQANSPVLLVSNTGLLSQMCVVNNVVNSSFMFLTSNVNFSCTNVIIYYPNIYANIAVTQINSITDMYVANVPGTMITNGAIVGLVSGAFATINSVVRNDVSKGFNTFIQLNKYSITTVSGAFIQNEAVLQGNTSGIYHSGNTGTIYLTNIIGNIVLSGQNIVGQQSGAIAQITKIYPQELVYGTGHILYVEDISPILRQTNQQEAFKLVYNF